ncbi:hypothetical protein [Halovivax limisalsi]|uniref:hypothetical protein n=1 Tax=Halovivax limisalsi TaxID=1453760 RepID=UPI001FFD06FC|nr:hypothetical protein [Halovivax limisalsi]
MKRRAVLAASGAAFSTVMAGCSVMNTEDFPDNCELIHDVGEPSEFDAPRETYRYENLSREARQVFDEALVDGSYFTTNQSLRSEELRYEGIRSIYHIIYDNETYGLATYVNEGCYGP